MEMEEVFLQLWEEVSRLQLLCSEQGKLLRRLRARKGPVPDIPVSLPVQCTEDTGTGERPPGSRQRPSEAPNRSTPSPGGSAHPMEQPQAASRSPGAGNGRNPAGTGSAAGGAAGAFGSSRARREDVQPWMKTWILAAPRDEGGAPCSPQGVEAPKPVVGGSFLSVLDLYGAPESLGREGVPREGALPVGAPVPVEIRGPVKTSWTPGWMLEEGALGHGSGPEAARACDLCQEIFPSDAAGQAEYLNHLLAHVE